MPNTVQPPTPAHLDGDEQSPQAGSLLVNSGQFGSMERVHEATTKHEDETTLTSSSLPHHHPADQFTMNETRPISESAPSSTVTNALVGRLEPKQIRSFGGVRLTTLLLCAIQLIALGGIIALWVFTTITVKATLESKHENTAGSLTVFIHVAFVFIFLGQLVFLQRGIHRLRRQRYQHLRGEVLPTQQHSRSSCDTLAALAPWNQPQPRLPIYRFQSGVATGDLEDNRMAISPPPAYGSMRGNTPPHSAR